MKSILISNLNHSNRIRNEQVMFKIRQMVEIGKQSISCTETAPPKMSRMWAFLHFFPYFSIQFFIKPHNLMISWLFYTNGGFTLTIPTIQEFMYSLHKPRLKEKQISIQNLRIHIKNPNIKDSIPDFYLFLLLLPLPLLPLPFSLLGSLLFSPIVEP